MKKADLLMRIEALEQRIAWLEARPHYYPAPVWVGPYRPVTVPYSPWTLYSSTNVSSGQPLFTSASVTNVGHANAASAFTVNN